MNDGGMNNSEVKDFNFLFSINALGNFYYLVRHGKSLANERNLIISSSVNGFNNYGLTDIGKKEIRASSISIKNEIHKNNKQILYSSPFLRTLETSMILSEVLGIKKINIESRLQERSFGILEHGDSQNYEKVWKQDYLNPFHTKWSVESVISVLKRTTSLIADIEEKFNRAFIFLVTHCDVAMILTAGALKLNPKLHRQLDSMKTGEIRKLLLSNPKAQHNL
jgi:glucosyl-3-phosphoglycerate phosphatase